jgi:cytochrome c553
MQAMIVPASDALFEVLDIEPKNDKAWATLRNHALILTEAGNLLMLEGHARDQGQWKKDARLQVDAGMAALKAVGERNVRKLAGPVGEQILASCQTCHEHYLKRSPLRSNTK